MRGRMGPPPWTSMRAAASHTVVGLFAIYLGTLFSGEIGVYVVLGGVVMTLVGAYWLFGRYGSEFRVAVVDLKERLLGQQRSKYER